MERQKVLCTFYGESNLENYYGKVRLIKVHNYGWYLMLDSHSSTCYVQVSEEFAGAYRKQFGEEESPWLERWPDSKLYLYEDELPLKAAAST